jgi:hypothetical protein
VEEMSRLIIKDIRNRTVEDDGKSISFEIIQQEGDSTECEVELALLGKIVLAFQDIYMKAMAKMQARPGFDETLYAIPFPLAAARVGVHSKESEESLVVLHMKSNKGMVIAVALPKSQAMRLGQQIVEQAQTITSAPTRLS